MTILIIDGNPICHRAYNVFDMQTSTGLQSGIVFGALGIIQSLLELDKFEDIVFCWDSGTPRLRSILYPAYKQKPPLKEGEKPYIDPEVFYPQMNSVYSILEAVGVKQFKIKGVEADDLIGIVTRRLFELDYSVAIAGNDVDLYQLIRGEDVVIYDTREKRWINENAAIKKIGVTPKQIVDLKALMGDPSDNISGAKGIGKVTAKNLIKKFGSVEAFLNECEFDKADKRTKGALKDYRSILFSKTLVQIITQPEDLGEGDCIEFKNQWQSNFYGEKIVNQAEAMAVMDMYEIQNFADPELFNMMIQKIHGGEKIPLKVREMELVDLELSECKRCSTVSVNPVPAIGTLRSEIMVVGRNPGFEEDKQGEPFIGRAGQRLNRMLNEAGLNREDCWITNVMHCFTENNRAPLESEIRNCVGYLQTEMDILRPRIILTLGKEAFETVVGFNGVGVTRNAGTVFDVSECQGLVKIPEECKVVVCNHPSHALRSPDGEQLFQLCTRVFKEFLVSGGTLEVDGGNVIPKPLGEQIQVVLGQVKCPDKGEIGWKQCIRCKRNGSINYDSGYDMAPQSIDCMLKIRKND